MLTKSKWTAGLLGGMALATFAGAQATVTGPQFGSDSLRPFQPGARERVGTVLGDALAPKSASYTSAFGIKDVQGQLRLYGKAGLELGGQAEDNTGKMVKEEREAAARKRQGIDEPTSLKATGGLAADVRFWDKQREIAAIELECKAPFKTGRARSGAAASREEAMRSVKPIRPTVRLVGFTIRLDSTPVNDSKGWHEDGTHKSSLFGPKDLLPQAITAQLMLGLVPILIRANGGVGIELGATPFVENYQAADGTKDLRVGMDATVGGYLNGWVTAGLGGGCSFASVCVGLKADVRPIDVNAGIKLGCGLKTGLFSQLHYKVEALVVKALAVACLEVGTGWIKISKKFEFLLFEWTAATLEGCIPPAPVDTSVPPAPVDGSITPAPVIG